MIFLENETCVSSLLHVLNRLFPFSRGIFEDKVSLYLFITFHFIYIIIYNILC
jgi:hypothetical protein